MLELRGHSGGTNSWIATGYFERLCPNSVTSRGRSAAQALISSCNGATCFALLAWYALKCFAVRIKQPRLSPWAILSIHASILVRRNFVSARKSGSEDELERTRWS